MFNISDIYPCFEIEVESSIFPINISKLQTDTFNFQHTFRYCIETNFKDYKLIVTDGSIEASTSKGSFAVHISDFK